MVKTPKKSSNSAFGFPAPFNPAMIPSKADVVKHTQFIQQKQTTKRNAKLSAKECQRIALNDLQNIWASFSFPTISYERICLKVERLMENASKLNKFPSKNRTNESFLECLITYDKVFDICTCSCYGNGLQEQIVDVVYEFLFLNAMLLQIKNYVRANWEEST